MNDKKAKRIRRQVRKMLDGASLPERELLRNTRTGLIINNIKSFRGLYRYFKKEIQRGADLDRVEGTPRG